MENKIGGWGFIVRDTNGFAVMAGAGKLESVHDAFCAEAQACLAAFNSNVDSRDDKNPAGKRLV